MARRNPGISPILSARGYAARVLWPKYTPEGGINSGSEIPVPPRNTLQSNQSNMIYRENPFTPVTQDAPGRIQVTSKRGKTLYMTENQILKMGSKMLADGEVERALGRSNPNAFKAGKGKFRRETQKSMHRVHKERAADAAQEGNEYYPDDPRPLGKFYQTGVPPMESEAAREADRRDRELNEMLKSTFFNPNAYKAGQGKFRRETQKSMHRAQYEAAAAAEQAGYSFPRSSTTPRDAKFHQRLNPRGSGDAPKRRGAFAEFEERMKRELGARGEYPVDSNGEPLANPYLTNPAADRLSASEMVDAKAKITQLLDSGVSHGDVRSKFGLSYPKYMAILRSGRQARSNPFGD
jgi:hypothetical protein